MTVLAPNFSVVPAELTRLHRWLVWRGAKIPYCAAVPSMNASSTAPETWASFEQARTTYEEGGFSGIGLALNGDGLVGVDLDKCVADGQPMPEALNLLDRLDCGYVEYSPSGNGLRGFGYGPNIKGTMGRLGGINVELYSTGRYLTVTGHAIRNGSVKPLSGFNELASTIRSDRFTDLQKEQMTQQSSSVSSVSSVGSAFIPEGVGQRNKRLFEFARFLKGTQPAATKAELREIITEWHRLALPNIGTSDFSESWGDFQRAWDSVRIPYGSVLNRLIGEIDMTEPVPDSLANLGYGEKALLLCRICKQLQRHAGDDPFFISSRQAGELIGLHFTDASKVLYALVADDVLQLVKRGAGTQASRYRYIWPDGKEQHHEYSLA